MKKVYRRKHHSVSMLHAHLIFCTKYRRRSITRRVFDVLKASMRKTAYRLDIELQAIESDNDHLHLMIACPPNLSLSEVVRRLKGAASRAVRRRRFPEVLKKLWGRHFWSPSYFVVSCGGAPLDVVKAYVDNQQTPNRKQKPPNNHRPTRKINQPPYPRTEVRGLRARL